MQVYTYTMFKIIHIVHHLQLEMHLILKWDIIKGDVCYFFVLKYLTLCTEINQ